jgi:hypothetical protein
VRARQHPPPPPLMMGKWTMFVRSILVVLCITDQVKVYLVTRRYLRQAEVPPLSIPLQQMVITPTNNGEESLRPASATAEETSSSLSVVANCQDQQERLVLRPSPE